MGRSERIYPRRMTKRFFRKLVPFALAACVAGASTLAFAAGVQQDLELAEQAYANLDYPEANKLADRVTKQRGLSHDQLVRSYRILALTHAVLDREGPAKDAFIALLTYDPEYSVDANLGPRVQTPFFEARGFWRAQSVKPGMEAATVLRPKEAGVIRVTTRDPTRVVKKVNVGYRWGAEGEMTVKAITAGDAIPVDVPAPPANVTRLDYYAVALDERDDSVFEFGNAQAPKTAVVQTDQVRVVTREGESRSVFSSPVFWIIAGAVVAGAGITVGAVALKPKDEQLPDTRLPPTNAGLSPVLNCGPGVRCN